MGQSNYVHLDGCDIVAVTDKAILVSVTFEGDDEPEKIWFPRSQIADSGDNLEEGDKNVTVSITEWIAKQKDIEAD